MTHQFLGFRIAKYDGVEIPAPTLVLGFSNPKYGAVVWDANLYDLSLRSWLAAEPSGIKELSAPCSFYPTGNTFLLRVMELPPAPLPGPYWLGPYLVTIPELGAYTWNSRDGKIDGITTIDMPHAPNESVVTGVITGFNWISEGQWGVSMAIQETQGGAGDFVQFFDSIYIRYASIPLDSLGAPLISTGERVTCRVSMIWDVYDYQWKGWDFKKVVPPFYPSGSLYIIEEIPTQPYQNRIWKVGYSVSSNLPQFGACIVFFGAFGLTQVGYFTGPGSGSGNYESNVYWHTLGLFANPEIGARWDAASWQYEGWKQVASLSLPYREMY